MNGRWIARVRLLSEGQKMRARQFGVGNERQRGLRLSDAPLICQPGHRVSAFLRRCWSLSTLKRRRARRARRVVKQLWATVIWKWNISLGTCRGELAFWIKSQRLEKDSEVDREREEERKEKKETEGGGGGIKEMGIDGGCVWAAPHMSGDLTQHWSCCSESCTEERSNSQRWTDAEKEARFLQEEIKKWQVQYKGGKTGKINDYIFSCFAILG